jgi:hypothetical protein
MSTRPCTSQSLLKDAYDRGNGTPHLRRPVDLRFEKEIERKFHSTDEDIEVTVFIKRDSLKRVIVRLKHHSIHTMTANANVNQ